jgi:hypothetical protein
MKVSIHNRMKRCAILGMILIVASCATNKKEQLNKFSNNLCKDLLQTKPNSETYDKIFSDSFKQSLNKAQFTQMTKGIVAQYGQCQQVTQKTEQGILTILTDRGNHLSFEMRLEKNSKKLAGLFFHGVKNDLNRFRDKAQWVCQELLKVKPTFVYKNHFSKSFRKAIPYNKLTEISSNLHKDFGTCRDIEIPKNALVKEFYTIQSNGKKLVFNLVVENKNDKNLITGLLYKGEKTDIIKFSSEKEILKELKKFDGLISTLLIEEGQKILDYKSTETHALGSVFKLYVLATLSQKIANKELSWDKKYPIKNKLKSLPSGVMQNYEKGRMVTLSEMATKMISISDNTATDHLIDIVGRKEIEKYIAENGLISKKSNYTPFLKTRELFAIRAFFIEKDYMAYAEKDRKGRLKMVNKVNRKSNKKILNKLKNWDKPRHITDVEWYATPQEVCKLNFLIQKNKDTKIREIMAVNAPFAQENRSFAYTGYKGGSEPGVLEMSYLLKKNDNKWSCLFIGQNNTATNINHSKFFQLAQSILSWYGTN